MKHYTIPVFVPELACPNRCVFCNQNSISGCLNQPSMEETRQIIEERLRTIPAKEALIEIGFFGGNFTGIEESIQRNYLEIAGRYLREGAIRGIRLSTRPDYIDSDALKLLNEYGVTTIELGAQSLDDEVLKSAGRGHTVRDVEHASQLIRKHGFSLGLQMMTGLPCDTPEKSILTAKKIIELGADNTRIYPTIVVKGTKLAELWQSGLYEPQSLDEAVALTASLLEIFKNAGVKVIRAGLHPSEELLNGGEMLAGPFHPNFRQLAETEVWRRKFTRLTESSFAVSQKNTGSIQKEQFNDLTVNNDSLPGIQKNAGLLQKEQFIDLAVNGETLTVTVSKEELHAAIGYYGTNKSLLEKYYSRVEFKIREDIESAKPLIIADKRIPLPAKNALRNMGETLFLEDQLTVYKSISGHPDIFMCGFENRVVVAPGLLPTVRVPLESAGIEVIVGNNNPGSKYPDTARYNAVITDNLLIHNIKITDSSILETFAGKDKIHVKQGYTRCNLLPLNNTAFITSDIGIEKVLKSRGFEVLFVDPQPVMLKGQKHGFFPGCCGIWGNKVIVNGSLKYHPAGEEIEQFFKAHSPDSSQRTSRKHNEQDSAINPESSFPEIISLYDGPLRDIGSLFFFECSGLNKNEIEKNQRISTIFESTNPAF
ncbi:MAG TPA: radical SAM protein [Lentimicrobium sp.]|nr:radical SAM protein [Lentimicrobium sp.]